MTPYTDWKFRAHDSPFLSRLLEKEKGIPWYRRPFLLCQWAVPLVGIVSVFANESWPIGLYYSLPLSYCFLHVMLAREAWKRHKQPVERLLRGASWDEFLVLPQPVLSLLSPSVYLSARDVRSVCLAGLTINIGWFLAHPFYITRAGVFDLLAIPPDNCMMAVLVFDVLVLISLLGPFYYAESEFWSGSTKGPRAPGRDLIALLETLIVTAPPLAVATGAAMGLALFLEWDPDYPYMAFRAALDSPFLIPTLTVAALFIFPFYARFIAKQSERYFQRLEDRIAAFPESQRPRREIINSLP